MGPIVALHHKLMGTGNKCEAIIAVKLFRDVLSKGVASTTRADPPATSVIRIRPEEIAHRAFVGDFLDAI